MTDRLCAVCGKSVPRADEDEHTRTNHLGPHYFWFDARKYKSEEPSATLVEIKRMADCTPGYQTFLEVPGGEDRGIGDGENISLTGEPHFYAVPPATMFG